MNRCISIFDGATKWVKKNKNEKRENRNDRPNIESKFMYNIT